MNIAYMLLFAVAFVFIVTVTFMTPMDRRVLAGFVLDAWRRVSDEVVYQFGRAKRWYEERQAKKAAAKSYGGS